MIGNYSFDNFYTNKNNTQAFLAARYVAEHPGQAGNPLYIYGFSGSGKTHLLYAIEQYINEHNPEWNVVLIPTVNFINNVIDVIRTGNNGKMKELRAKYQSADIMLVDDIHYLINKESSEEEFIYTINTLFEIGKQIVITGDVSPRELQKKGLSEKIVSRLTWGNVVEISSDWIYPVNSVPDSIKKDIISFPEKYKSLESFQNLWLCDLKEYFVSNKKISIDYMEDLSRFGLKRKYGANWEENKEIRDRLKYELHKINSCQMTGIYFLLWDLISYAKSKDILISPGCGAIPGSLVAYGLGITDVDPIKYGLLMDRFISNKEEVNPGCRIELEIGGCRCLEEYINDKYGKGMLILLEKLDITFREMEELSIIKEILINVSKGQNVNTALSDISYSDAAVFNLINKDGIKDIIPPYVISNRVFAEEINIESMEDLIARIAMDRPGLEERCSMYIENKNNPENINYECKKLESILAPTYGCIVYQEQIMQILNSLGGFSPEQSDSVRRGMSKRKCSINVEERHDFVYGNNEKSISGCVAKGISKNIAEKIYDDMWTAAGYTFNKAHAAAYSTLIYRMAWLKQYYSEEYSAAVRRFDAN